MKKTLIIMLCAVLTLGSIAMGTIAYLTDSKSIANTFTVGDVQIKLDEAVVNKDGKPVNADGEVVENADEAVRTAEGEGNEYHLIPGKSYVKDPTVTVLGNSEESFVRMLVEINNKVELKAICDYMKEKDPENFSNGLPQEFVSDYDAEVWEFAGIFAETDDTITYEFRYFETVKPEGGANVELKPLFTAINVPGLVTEDQLATMGDLEIIVTGQAIQTAAFEATEDKSAEDAAWEAFDIQNPAKTTEDENAGDEGTEGEGAEGEGTEGEGTEGEGTEGEGAEGEGTEGEGTEDEGGED